MVPELLSLPSDCADCFGDGGAGAAAMRMEDNGCVRAMYWVIIQPLRWPLTATSSQTSVLSLPNTMSEVPREYCPSDGYSNPGPVLRFTLSSFTSALGT